MGLHGHHVQNHFTRARSVTQIGNANNVRTLPEAEILRERLARYKERRLKFGLFYLAPHKERLSVVVVSHLKHTPLKEALRRSRLDLDRRRRILERYNARRRPPALSSPTAKLVLYTVCSVFLACLIILC
jgi:hypothetical protein